MWTNDKDFDKANRCLNQALTIYQNYYGDNDFAVSDTLNHLGRLHQQHGKHEKALKLYSKVLTKRRSSLGDHPEVAESLRNIAGIQTEKGDYASALNNYVKTLHVYVQSIGKKKPFADTLVEASYVLESLGDTKHARDGFKEAIRVYKLNKLDNHSPSVVKAMEISKSMKKRYNDKKQYLDVSRIEPFLGNEKRIYKK